MACPEAPASIYAAHLPAPGPSFEHLVLFAISLT
jgi:MFS family permease